MLEEASLRPGHGFSVKSFLGYYSLRLVPWIRGRRLIAGAFAATINRKYRKRSASGDALAPEINDADHYAAALKAQGLALATPVPHSHIEDIQNFLRSELLRTSDGRTFTVDDVPKDVQLASYSLDTILRCPHLLELMNSETALGVAERYLGCKPTISAVRIDWTFPSINKPLNVQTFHRDLDDWSFVKLFVYLTDVTETSGPHVFVTESHSRSRQPRVHYYSDEQVRNRYGEQRVRRIKGPRGTAFYEDTWGLHKGELPIDTPRLMFQVQYSVLPIFKYNYKPVSVASAKRFDPYVNRLILNQ